MSGGWVKVYDASNNLEAHSIKGMLEYEHIEVQLSGESLSSAAGELPADVLQVGVWVLEAQVSAARHLILSYECGEFRDWICSRCGERNEGQFEICWRCGQEQP